MEILQYFLKLDSLRAMLIWVVSCLFICLWIGSQRKRNLPPGPTGLPGVGCIPYLILAAYRSGLPLTEPHLLLTELTKRYGNIYSMYIGTKLIVVLNSHASIREAFQSRYISDRPFTDIGDKLDEHGEGVNLSSGAPWIEQRRFTLRAFNTFGLGKRRFEDQIMSEVHELIAECAKNEGRPFDLETIVPKATANILCSVIFGRRFDYNDPKFERLLYISNRQIQIIGSGVVALYIPIIQYFQGDIYEELIAITKEQRAEFNEIIAEHKKHFDPDHLNDYLDVYINEIEKSRANGTESEVNYENLIATIRELFGAGTGSSASTMRWIMLHMLAYPDVQTRVQHEIDTVVGRNRLPCLSDKPNLVYTQAAILEAQRIQSVGPLGFPHLTSAETTIGNFEIPAKAIVVPNCWAIDHDPKIWEHPFEFNPDRFIDANGDLVNQERVIPFSVGRRVCLGENLAKMELFLFFSCLLHQFTFVKPDGSPPLNFKGIIGSTYSPQLFDVLAAKRE